MIGKLKGGRSNGSFFRGLKNNTTSFRVRACVWGGGGDLSEILFATEKKGMKDQPQRQIKNLEMP